MQKTWAADPALWEARLRPDWCPLCENEPDSPYVELSASRAILPEEAALPGYALVVSRAHVIEPYDLSPEDGHRFWDDAMLVARAVASVLKPVKVNYEIHGNTIPHLHLHVFPRFIGDPFERGPIDPQGVPAMTRSPEDVERLRSAIATAARTRSR